MRILAVFILATGLASCNLGPPVSGQERLCRAAVQRVVGDQTKLDFSGFSEIPSADYRKNLHQEETQLAYALTRSYGLETSGENGLKTGANLQSARDHFPTLYSALENYKNKNDLYDSSKAALDSEIEVKSARMQSLQEYYTLSGDAMAQQLNDLNEIGDLKVKKLRMEKDAMDASIVALQAINSSIDLYIEKIMPADGSINNKYFHISTGSEAKHNQHIFQCRVREDECVCDIES